MPSQLGRIRVYDGDDAKIEVELAVDDNFDSARWMELLQLPRASYTLKCIETTLWWNKARIVSPGL